MMFELHPTLEQDSILIGRFGLCQVRLINDSAYPWVILVPEREGITEIHQLSVEDRCLLTEESAFLSATLAKLFDADKMNVAALGNMVPQLHIHHIVRHKSDPAWPAPIWGKQAMTSYSDEAFEQTADQIAAALQEN
jgi:diadenosine tetraphosphate (Ap4A) HIT family hydrolase